MNEKRDTFMDLESDIHGLSSMASIMADLLDDALTTHAFTTPDGGVLLTDGQLDDLAFAWNDVVRRANSLKKRYLAIANDSPRSKLGPKARA